VSLTEREGYGAGERRWEGEILAGHCNTICSLPTVGEQILDGSEKWGAQKNRARHPRYRENRTFAQHVGVS
jgi:hypothetical protein